MQVPVWRPRFNLRGRKSSPCSSTCQAIANGSGREISTFSFCMASLGHFQHDCGKLHDFLILRPCQFLESGHVLRRNVRLGEEIEDLLLALYDSAIGFRHDLTALAHMGPMAFARKLFVGSFTCADSAVVSHSDPVFLD